MRCPGRALATGTAWAGLCLIHHHRALRAARCALRAPSRSVALRRAPSRSVGRNRFLHLFFCVLHLCGILYLLANISTNSFLEPDLSTCFPNDSKEDRIMIFPAVGTTPFASEVVVYCQQRAPWRTLCPRRMTLAEPTRPRGRPTRRLGLRLPAGEYRPAPRRARDQVLTKH